MARLGNRWTELQCVADAFPRLYWKRGPEPSCADRRLGVADAPEDRDSVLPPAAHHSGSGADFRFDGHSKLTFLRYRTFATISRNR